MVWFRFNIGGAARSSAIANLRKRLMQVQRLEDRLALHEEEAGSPNGTPWLEHLLGDTAIFDSTAGAEPTPNQVVAADAVGADPIDVGQWGALQNWQIEFINAIMLPTGKVLGYDRTLNLRLWDPDTGAFTQPASPGFQFFCSGMSLLADGDVLMTGGHVVDTVGLPYAALYNPFTDSWTQLGNMNAGRWYPSTTTLANGDALVLSGDTNGNVTDPLPQVYDAETGTWRDLTGAVQTLPFYPRTFSAPNGDAFIAGPQQFTEYLDTSGVGQIIPVGNRVFPNRDFGSAVMYAPGKILYVGGGGPATNTAEVIDLNVANPVWRSVAPMAFGRRNCNATLLPNGEVLIIGGNTGSGTYDGDAVMAAEIWNPVTETFRTVANMSDIRWYHSVALLLPDGRVLSTSGDLHLTGQVYSPPYLFQGTRPTISSAPGTVGYGDTFFVGTPDAATITDVRWIRMGTATHAQDWDQYMQQAQFTQTAGGLSVSAPPVPDASPPGYYYLYILKNGVPSVSKIIRVGDLPTVSVTGTTVTEGATGNTVNAQFTVSLSEASAKTITVNYATANDTAVAGQDYNASTGTITFAPGVTTQTVTVPITGDGILDPNEMFTLNLSTPVNAQLGIAVGQGLIRDFASLPVLQVKGATVVEGDAGTQNAAFVVSLSTASATPVTVAYTTVNGTATAGNDFTATAGTLTFAPGVTQQTINVPIKGDTVDEYNNTFNVQLSNPAGATIDVAAAQGLIYNNDAPTVASLANTATINEPAAGTMVTLTMTASLSAPSGKPVNVHWQTSDDGTAIPGRNYVDQVGVFTFAPGTTTQTFTVTVMGDGVKRPNGTFSIKMQSELENANYGNRYTLVTIVDTNTVPAITLTPASITEGNTGTKNLVFTAALSAAVAQAVTVTYTTSAGTATAGTDYTEATGTITFAANTTTKTFNIVIRGDATAESNETFNVVLSNPVGATIEIGQVRGTILDDDNAGVPAAPTNLAATAGFAVNVLAWSPVAGATSYRIYRGTNPYGEGTTPIATGVTGVTFTDTGLVNGKPYYYTVTAVKGALEGAASQEVTVTPTSFDFSNGFVGYNPDPDTVHSFVTGQVLSHNGLNIANWRLAGETLQLTDGGTNQTDSVFTRIPVSVARFTTQFTFQQIASFLYTDPLAEGLTFTIQGVSPTVLGTTGSGLGYGGIAKSVAIKFDLADNNGEGPNSTGLYTNGAAPTNLNSINLNGTGIDLHSGHPFSVAMSYDGTTLTVTITDTVTLATATQNYTVNIPAIVGTNTAYVGFTGGTGEYSAVQKIQNWIFTPAPSVPTNLLVTGSTAAQVSLSWTNTDPNAANVVIERRTGLAGTYVQVGATTTAAANTFVDTTVAAGTTYYYRVRSNNKGSTSVASNEVNVTTQGGTQTPVLDFATGFTGTAAQFSFNGTTAPSIVGGALQITGGVATTAASVFALTQVNVQNFTTQFSFNQVPGTATTADGMTFMLQGVGPAVVGGTGGGLGFAGTTKSVAIKFDLYDNAGEGPNSTGLYINGVQPNAVNSVNLTGTGIDLHSGHTFNVTMSYNGTTLTVTITDSVTLATATQNYTVDIPTIVGANTAYVGFSGGTGGLTAVQKVLNWTFSNTTAPTPPTAPTGLQVTSSTAAQVSLGWTNTDATATAVLIERKTGAAGTYAQIGTSVSPGNTYVDNTVAANTTYVYRVRATNGTLNSTYSNEVTVTTGTVVTPVLNFPNGFAGAAAQFSLNGTTAPTIVGSALQITSGVVTTAASAFALTPVNITNFTTQFSFSQLPGTATTADGMTFMLQGVGPAVVGGTGGGLGFAGTTKSVAIKFDLYDNAGEGPNSTGLYINGVQPNGVNSINLTGTGIDLHSGNTFNVTMSYNGTTLTVTITDSVTLATATQDYTVDIATIVGANTAYVGFSGGTGGLTAVQKVLNWTFTNTTAPTPPTAPTGLQVTGSTGGQVSLSWTNTDATATAVLIERKTGLAGTYAAIGTAVAPANTFVDNTVAGNTTYYYRVRATNGTLNSTYSNEVNVTTPVVYSPTLNFATGFTGTAAQFSFNGTTAPSIVGGALQITGGVVTTAASAFALTQVNVTNFTTQFSFNQVPGTANTADGMTFMLQGVGPTAVGGTGGGLGFAGTTKSVAIKFDLYDNAGEGPNSTGLYINGVQPNAVNSVNLTGTGIDLHSGHTFNVTMSYNGTTLTVTITDSVTLATATQNYTVDIPTIVGANTAYVGFSGGTGGLTAVQKVLNWTFSNPTPAALVEEHEHIPSADANGDGYVDGADYIIWSDNVGRVAIDGEHLPGDFNFSGAVDGADYILWADTFSPPPEAPVVASMPLASSVPVAASLPMAAAVPVIDDSPNAQAEEAVSVTVSTLSSSPVIPTVQATALAVAAPADSAPLTVGSSGGRPAAIDNLLANVDRVARLVATIRSGTLRDESLVGDLPAKLEQHVEELFATTSWVRRFNRRDK